MESNEHKYSILMPTYNERENISLMIYLIDKLMTQKYFYLITQIVKLSMRSSLLKITALMAQSNV
mgnify:CR=1 FL=1